MTLSRDRDRALTSAPDAARTDRGTSRGPRGRGRAARGLRAGDAGYGGWGGQVAETALAVVSQTLPVQVLPVPAGSK
jgi:hypothetical protein